MGSMATQAEEEVEVMAMGGDDEVLDFHPLCVGVRARVGLVRSITTWY